MGNNCCSASAASKEAVQEALEWDKDKDGKVSKEELEGYIEANAQLWSMLAVNCNLPEDKCRDIAVRVAYQMAKWDKSIQDPVSQMSQSEIDREPTVREFSKLLDFVRSPKGNLEFFHRTVFAAFDRNQNGVLEPDELDDFLSIYYEAGSIFAGDFRLPSKSVLKQNVMQQFDQDGDGKIDFEELQTLLSAGGNALAAGQEASGTESTQAVKKERVAI